MRKKLASNFSVSKRLFPFLEWFKDYSLASLRADFVAGLTVALVLIPQSMAYAQLAGLPAYYGLYAAFLPPMVASLFGSSRQLATGPVAVVSLMTAASLEPLATAGSEAFIVYAISLAFIVGIFQLTLGLLRLGIIVNFLSHPVVNGFTNAAAIIIATSQLSKLFGVYVDKADHHYETIGRVLVEAFHFTHWPTFGLAALAFAIMYGMRKINSRLPFVLVAVAVTALISWYFGFEHNRTVSFDSIHSSQIKQHITLYNTKIDSIEQNGLERTELGMKISTLEEAAKDNKQTPDELLSLSHKRNLLNLKIEEQKTEASHLRKQLRSYLLRGVREPDGLSFYMDGQTPSNLVNDDRYWRIKVGNFRLKEDVIVLMGGGAVVGKVPQGLPTLKMPNINLSIILRFLSVAAVISLLGFMEAISIAKAMASKTKQRLDPNQELIGQGLANIIGSIGQSYPISGSFSRSAVNIGAGAICGMSSVFTSLLVIITLLFFTPLLYYIPQSVLAAVIMMAVIGLVNIRGFVHAFRAQKYDGIIAVISFVCTLAFAPHLDKGIMIGVGLSILHYLYRNTKPSVTVVSMHPDGSLRDAKRHGLKECKHIAVIRFEGPLFFANTNYLEDKINEKVQCMPQLRHILLAANGINEIDASGEDMLSLFVDRLRDQGLEISFSGLNENVLALMRRTHLYEKIGEDRVFPTQIIALKAIHEKAHKNSDEKRCPLIEVNYWEPEAHPKGQLAVRDFKILWVQENANDSNSMVRKLRRKGLSVTLTKNLPETLGAMEKKFHEVVLINIEAKNSSRQKMMESMHSRWPQTQMIVLSESPTVEEATQVKGLGAFDCLGRPCEIENLIAVINKAIIDIRSRNASEVKRSPEGG